MEGIRDILTETKESSNSFIIRNGKKYMNFNGVDVPVSKEQFRGKTYSISRSNRSNRNGDVGVITCMEVDEYGMHVRDMKTTIYYDVVKFNKAINRIQRKYNKFINLK